jgi:hypothetical protein
MMEKVGDAHPTRLFRLPPAERALLYGRSIRRPAELDQAQRRTVVPSRRAVAL